MKSATRGSGTSKTVEVSQVSMHGIWLLVKGKEYFLSFEQYPWFRNATVSQIHHVRLLHRGHLYWPDLDIDLSIDIIEKPSQYPLFSTIPPG